MVGPTTMQTLCNLGLHIKLFTITELHTEGIIRNNRTIIIIIIMVIIMIMSIIMVEGGLTEGVKVSAHSIIITTIIGMVHWIGGINQPLQVMTDAELYD